MKILPIVKCKGCPAMLEFEREDVKEQGVGFKFTIECPLCHATMLVNHMMEFMPKEEPETVPVPAEIEPPRGATIVGRADTDAEKLEKGQRAFRAYAKHRSYSKAADELGVSTTTIKNWLEFLPPDYAGE